MNEALIAPRNHTRLRVGRVEDECGNASCIFTFRCKGRRRTCARDRPAYRCDQPATQLQDVAQKNTNGYVRFEKLAIRGKGVRSADGPRTAWSDPHLVSSETTL
jgi:hypothetical protein